MRHIFRTARSTNFKLGTWMEDDDPHQPQVPWPPRSEVKVARSRDQSEPSWPNAVPVLLEAGGSRPCRRNPAATLLVSSCQVLGRFLLRCASADLPAPELCFRVARSSIRLLPNVSTRYVENKWIDWCKLAQGIHGARVRNDQLWDSGVQRSRSHEAKDNFGGLADASFSTPWLEWRFGLVVTRWLRTT